MSERFRLFVYGQLRRGESGYRCLHLEERTRWLGEARVVGSLYDLGDCPGLSLGGDGIVHGELLGFDDPALWVVLDAYEECDPERPEVSEYRRAEIDLLDGGRSWVYEYTRSTDGRPKLGAGDWRVSSDHARQGGWTSSPDS
jgi:gamma-glutamylcyclotransferase (GGCT)/AIG2-like uncharacterized protein YtfP